MQDPIHSPATETDPALEQSIQKSRAAWARWIARLASITPGMVARTALVLGFAALILWVVAQAWLALLPFLFGGAIAYALLPLVDRLDKFLPRTVAALVALVPVFALIGLFVWLLVPIAVRQFTVLTVNLPTEVHLNETIDRARAYIATLPPNAQATIYNLSQQMTAVLETRGAELSAQAVNVLINVTLGAFNALGFLLGFVIVPAWILIVLTEQKNAARATRNLLPRWMQGDVWAVLRILDRSFGWFLRGQVLLGIASGFLVYGGLEILVRVLGRTGNVNYQLLLALFAGLMQLIPVIGPLLGAIPGVLLGFSLSPELGIGAIGVYIAVQAILENLFLPQLQGRIAGLNRNLLILVIVAMGAINFWLVLIAAPIAGIVYDVFRYAYGRVGDPARPAGIIPSDAAWKKWNLPVAAAQPKRAARLMRQIGPARYDKE